MKLLGLVLGVLLAVPIFAQEAGKERIETAGRVLAEMLKATNEIPQDLLDKARCVIVVPSVVKSAFIVGASYGRGVITCRSGENLSGPWSAPSVIALEGSSLGVQLGGQATDFVLLLMSRRSAERVLSGKTTIGADASAAAGPKGRDAAAATDASVRADILIYSRSRGLFAGVSLEGSTLHPDNDANRNLYGKEISASDIVLKRKVKPPPTANELLASLNERSPNYWGATIPSGGTHTHITLADPIWNLWTEEYSAAPSFEPVRLQPSRDYSLIVDIAAIPFAHFEDKTAYSVDASPSFSHWLLNKTNQKSVEADVLLIPDRRYFRPQLGGEKVKSLHIDLDKVRKLQQSGFDLDGSPFAFLQSHDGKAPFSFGIQSFRIRTTSQTGTGSIAISIWANGKPIDEISLEICITAQEHDPCNSAPPTNVSLKGVDLSRSGKYPDAALHLIDRQSDVVGVFRCNTCGWSKDDYRTWEVEQTADWFSKRTGEILHLMGQAFVTGDHAAALRMFQQAGDAMHNVIFHSHDAGVDDVEAEFAKFVLGARSKVQGHEPPPSLFVRLVPSEPDLVIAPIGLMRVRLPDDSNEFVGFDVNLQTPLEYQDYSSPSACIAKWVLFVPPNRSPVPSELQQVSDARAEFNDWITAFSQSCPDCVKDDENKFQGWLGETGKADSYAVLILSHHDANGLFFNSDTESPAILSTSIRKTFATPSLVVLDACGTSEPGASEFIREFNFHGVNTVIATSTEVEPKMAGQFLTILLNLLRDHAKDLAYTVSQARFEAVQALSRQPAESPYGPKALAFILAGNGALRLCVPPQQPQNRPGN